MITEFMVMPGKGKNRLDVFLANHERGMSRSRLHRLIVAGRVQVNDQRAKPGQKVKGGDHIVIEQPTPGPMIINKKVVALDILYEDEVLLVINKPSGVVVHPSPGNWEGTLLNSLLKHRQSTCNGNGMHWLNCHAGLVHRLDKETSGVMMVAKTKRAHADLSLQFEKRTVRRMYEALAYGVPSDKQGTIILGLGHDIKDEKKVSDNTIVPRSAVTKFRILQSYDGRACHLELLPETGRKHQLRVHLASRGCPILGDQIYSDEKAGSSGKIAVSRLMLHARSIGLRHPVSGRWNEFRTELPSEMEDVMKKLHALT